MKNRWLIIIAGLLLFGCTAKKAEQPEEEHVVTVDVAPVLTSSIALKVTSDALLYPLQQAAIVPKISAPIKKFYVDRGARVRAGPGAVVPRCGAGSPPSVCVR